VNKNIVTCHMRHPAMYMCNTDLHYASHHSLNYILMVFYGKAMKYKTV